MVTTIRNVISHSFYSSGIWKQPGERSCLAVSYKVAVKMLPRVLSLDSLTGTGGSNSKIAMFAGDLASAKVCRLDFSDS